MSGLASLPLPSASQKPVRHLLVCKTLSLSCLPLAKIQSSLWRCHQCTNFTSFIMSINKPLLHCLNFYSFFCNCVCWLLSCYLRSYILKDVFQNQETLSKTKVICPLHVLRHIFALVIYMCLWPEEVRRRPPEVSFPAAFLSHTLQMLSLPMQKMSWGCRWCLDKTCSITSCALHRQGDLPVSLITPYLHSRTCWVLCREGKLKIRVQPSELSLFWAWEKNLSSSPDQPTQLFFLPAISPEIPCW